jgi:uncharacterized repeat protein (TIGR02543 family)
MSVFKLKKISLIVIAAILAVALHFMIQVTPTFAETITYIYDANGQLIGADYGGGNTITYTYDEAGNILTKVTAGRVQQYTLTVSRSGMGSGTVTSSPAGINCGSGCSAAYNQGTVVTLTATASAGSTFQGWSGGCSGTGVCSVTMNANVTVTANFQGQGSPTLNLTPYQPQGWSDKIVVTNKTGCTNSSCTDSSPLLPTDTLYVDWAVINQGPVATAVRFCNDLYVDGVEKGPWCSDPPINANTYIYLTNFSIGSLSAGTHKIKLVADSTGAISETNEADNEYTKTITVSSSGNVPHISVSPDSLDFGVLKMKKSKTASFVVKNSGKTNLSISSSIIGTDASMFAITSGSGSKTVKPGKTLTIKVAFKPASKGPKSANLEITSNDPVTPTDDVPLSGTGQ